MIKGYFGFAPTCPKCSKPLVAGSTIYDPKTVCQCPVDWKKLAKNAGRRAKRFNDVVEEAHRKAGKSKLHFGDSDICLRTRMDFSDCVLECARNDDFIREFNRLTGCHFGKSLNRKPIEVMIDKATGYSGESQEDIVRFIQFVWEFVWCTLPEEAFVDSDG